MRKMYYQSPVGRLELTADEKGLCSLAFGETEQYAEVQEEETPFLKSVCGQLQEYFAGKRKKFEVQLSLHGSHKGGLGGPVRKHVIFQYLLCQGAGSFGSIQCGNRNHGSSADTLNINSVMFIKTGIFCVDKSPAQMFRNLI